MAENNAGWHLFCPLMKEVCHNGHTLSMGTNKETDEPVQCALWQERMVYKDKEKTEVVPARACYFHHATGLDVEKIIIYNQGRAATDEVRKRLDRIIGLSVVQLLDTPGGATPALENAPAELPPAGENGVKRLS